MKKILLAAVAASMLFVSTASAESGKVHGVVILADGGTQIVIDVVGDGAPANLRYAKATGSADKIKAMTAVALTAKSLDSDVYVSFSNAAGGWNVISIR